MSTRTSPRVSVVVVSYNSSETLLRCFDCLSAQTYSDFQVVLVDNASQVSPGEFLSRLTMPVTYLEMTNNLGFAQAMNIGLEASDSPLLVALNPDAFPHPNWLEALVTASDEHNNIAAFGSLQISAADSECIDGYGDHYLISGQAWRGQSRPKPEARHIDHCFGVCAAGALYRTAALREIGGFDQRFFCFYEDIDVSFRLRLAGYGCAVVPTAVIDHIGGASFVGKSDFAEYLIARNQWWVLIRNMPTLLLIVAVPGFALIQITAMIKSRRPARLKGLWESLRRTREFLPSRRHIQTKRKISALQVARYLSWNPCDFRRKTSPSIRAELY
tara:strand:+ start:388 stop:1377 length:990 start_codon:yes stop_codon:yes gene_type:complete